MWHSCFNFSLGLFALSICLAFNGLGQKKGYYCSQQILYFRLKMKMIRNLEIRGMKMRMEMKRNKIRMLLCVTKRTRLHCFWGKSYYWCTKENICLWEADGEMTTMGLVLSYSSVGKSFVLGKANNHSFSST